MSNIDAMFESDFWRACDLDGGKTFTGKIASVDQGELQIAGTSQKKRKPVITFSNSKKKLALNKTNVETIKQSLGKNSSGWEGCSITLYQVNDAKLGKKTVDALRVKNVKGRDGKRTKSKNTGSAATAKDLEYALAGIEGCATAEELGEFLASVRKKQWNKEQGAKIAGAKEAWFAAHEQTVSDSQEANETETPEEPATEEPAESETES